jgi:hypothetical protein
MKPIQIVTSACAALIAPLLLCGPASAGEWKFTVVNKGNLPAIEFRTREDGEWSSNWISERVEPGDSFEMDFGTSEGECTVRTQIRFTDGSYFDANVNYCKISTLYIHDTRLTAD